MPSFNHATLLVLSLLTLLMSAFVRGDSCRTVNGKPFPSLIDVTLDDLVNGLQNGQFTSIDLVKAYIARINEVNSVLHAVTEVNPDAAAIAQQLDSERAANCIRGPLHGIPILIKNNIATMDKMDNDAGSYALLKTTVPRDSGVAAKLRAAGAIILGKSNMSQWANFRSDNSSNGWSALEGQTYGPYHPDQDPSGSSSGSAVASAIGLAFAALGTETDGSIVSPSEFNNVVGIKPTVGLTSRSLVIPVSPRQDTVGPIARTVKDAAYILQAIAGKDPYDNYTSAIPFTSLPNYVAACKSDCLQGVRIGVPRNAITIEKPAGPVLAAFEAAITVLKSAGAIIVDHADFTAYQQFEDSKSPDTVLGADFVSALPQYLSELTSNPQNVNDVDSIRKFTQGFPSEGYPGRNTATWDDAIALGFNNTDPRFWAAYQENLYLGGEGGVLGALRRHDLSALILPTDLASNLPALIGTPLITVPLGFYPPNAPIVKSQPRMDLIEAGPNIPFGLSFLGPAWSEASLISFAYAYEQRTQTRNMVHPYIAPQTELCDIVG